MSLFPMSRNCVGLPVLFRLVIRWNIIRCLGSQEKRFTFLLPTNSIDYGHAQ